MIPIDDPDNFVFAAPGYCVLTLGCYSRGNYARYGKDPIIGWRKMRSSVDKRYKAVLLPVTALGSIRLEAHQAVLCPDGTVVGREIGDSIFPTPFANVGAWASYTAKSEPVRRIIGIQEEEINHRSAADA